MKITDIKTFIVDAGWRPWMFVKVETDEGIGAMVLTGSEKAFAAGADIKAMKKNTFASNYMDNFITEGWERIATCRKPVIAAVNGFALGGGTEIALAADIVVASEQATFGLPEVTRGFIAGAGGILRLSRQVPVKIAARAILEGGAMSAAEAARWGLVNEVVPHEQVDEHGMCIAEKVAANAPKAVVMSKEVLYRGLDAPLDFPPTARAMNRDYVDQIMLTEDAKEGPRAFAEHREPIWKNC